MDSNFLLIIRSRERTRTDCNKNMKLGVKASFIELFKINSNVVCIINSKLNPHEGEY